MRCDELRSRWADGEDNDLLREHLKSCAGCREWQEAWGVLRLGLRALAAEPAPEPRLGFAARLERRLGEAARDERPSMDFFERAGRRVAWATLTLTLAVLLALALPSTGPVRGPGEIEYLLPQPSVASVQTEMVVDVDAPDLNTPAPVGRPR